MNFAIPLITNDSKATVSVLYCVLCESLFFRPQRKMSISSATLREMMSMLDTKPIRASVGAFKCLAKKGVFGPQEVEDMILPWLKKMSKPTKLLEFSGPFKVVAFVGMNKYFYLGQKEMSDYWTPVPIIQG